MDFNLQKLEQKSVYIIRQARAEFKNIGVLEVEGKDGSMLIYLCKKAFFGKIPFSVINENSSSVDALIIPHNHDFKNDSLVAIRPLSSWTELDIWRYIKEKDIPTKINEEEVNQLIKELEARQNSKKGIDEKASTMQRLKDLGYL